MKRLFYVAALVAACSDPVALKPDPAATMAADGSSSGSTGPASAGGIDAGTCCSGDVTGSRLRPFLITASDGTVTRDHARWWDSALDEECRLRSTDDVHGACLPALVESVDYDQKFSDPTCKIRVLVVAKVHESTKSVTDTTIPPRVFSLMPGVAIDGGGTSYWLDAGTCLPNQSPLAPLDIGRAIGPEVPLSDFVSTTSAPAP